MLAMAAVLVVIKTPLISIAAMNLVFFLVAAATFFYSGFFKTKSNKGRFFSSVPFVTLVCALFMIVLNVQFSRIQISAAPIMTLGMNAALEESVMGHFWIKILLAVCIFCLELFVLWFCRKFKAKSESHLRRVLEVFGKKNGAFSDKSNEAVDFASVVDASSRFICGAAKAIVFIQLLGIGIAVVLGIKNGNSDVMGFIGLHLALTAAASIFFTGTFVCLFKSLENLFYSNN